MNNKELYVATGTRDIAQKINQIRRVMKGYPEGITPKRIALLTRINVNTVKSILPKMKDVKKIMRGFYKVVNGGDSPTSVVVDLFDWTFHNLVLSASLFSCPAFFSERVFDFGLVKATLYLSTSGKATFRLSSDFPLNVSSLSFVAGFFSQAVIDYCGGTPLINKDIIVSTIEFNRDYKNLRLDGVQSISVDNLIEQFKIYQKTGGMRVEHKTKVPMSVENIVDMLSNNPNSVELNVKLAQQKTQLERLTKATSVTTNLLYKLIDAKG